MEAYINAIKGYNLSGNFVTVLNYLIFATTFLVIVYYRVKLNAMQKDLNKVRLDEGCEFKHRMMNIIGYEYKNLSESSKTKPNTWAMIERHFSRQQKGLDRAVALIKNLPILMMILGMIGTVYEFSMYWAKMAEHMKSAASVEVLKTIDNLAADFIFSANGMSNAFIPCLYGATFAILLKITANIFDLEEGKNTVMVELEDYLDNVLEPQLAQSRETEIDLLKNILIQSFDGFKEDFGTSLVNSAEGINTCFLNAAGYISASTEKLAGSISSFNGSIEKLCGVTKDFSEFNYNLKSNIERMDLCFADLRESMVESAKAIKNSYGSTNEFGRLLEVAATTIPKEEL